MKNIFNSKREKVLAFSLFFLFIFIFFSINAEAVSVNLLQSKAITNARGTAGIAFDSTGSRAFLTDEIVYGSEPNFISQYNLSLPYDIDTMLYSNELNLSTLLPANYDTFFVLSSSMSANGENLFLVMANITNYHSIIHLKMSAWDLNTLAYSESYDIGFNVPTAGWPIALIRGIQPSYNGTLLGLTGRFTIGGTSKPSYFFMEMSQPYNVSTLTLASGNPFSLTINSYYGFGYYWNMWNSPDYTYNFWIERDTTGGQYALEYFNNSGTLTQVVSPAFDKEGLYLASYFSSVYMFTQSGGVLYKYDVSDISTAPTAVNETSESAQNFLTWFINPVLELFPDSQNLSLGQRLGFVFIVMFLTAIALLYASSQLSYNGIHSMIIWVVLIILVIEFLFFLAIKYIPIGFFIILVLIAIAVSYLRLRSK